MENHDPLRERAKAALADAAAYPRTRMSPPRLPAERRGRLRAWTLRTRVVLVLLAVHAVVGVAIVVALELVPGLFR